MKMLTVTLALACALSASSALAHHPTATLGTVQITQPVMAGGTVLQPGTYEVRDTGEHVKPLPGQSEDAQTRVEFVPVRSEEYARLQQYVEGQKYQYQI